MAERFNSGMAERFGITAALLLEHIWREVKENEFHHRHCYEGNTWMRCSKKAFTVHMPYLSRGMITCGIGRLKKAGILVQGEHNGSRFDRTAWYAFTEYGKKVMEGSEDGMVCLYQIWKESHGRKRGRGAWITGLLHMAGNILSR